MNEKQSSHAVMDAAQKGKLEGDMSLINSSKGSENGLNIQPQNGLSLQTLQEELTRLGNEPIKPYEVKNTVIPDDNILKLLNDALFDVNMETSESETVVFRDDIASHRKHNFSIVSGLEGSRKTWFSLSIAASFFSDYMGFQSGGGGTLLWFDTEQADDDLKNVTDRFFRITKLSKDDERVKFFALREYAPELRTAIIEKAIQEFQPDMVILDGGADLISTGVNDESESNKAVQNLMTWTKIYDCHIVNVVHNSHGNEKARGHYGSTALRKCETAYVLTSEADITKVKYVKTRKKRPDDFCFYINEETILPELTNAPIKTAKNSNLLQLFKQVLPLPKSSSHAELFRKVMEVCGVQDAMAKRKIKDALALGILEKNTTGYYSLHQEEVVENYEYSSAV